jgi:signal peptidase II
MGTGHNPQRCRCVLLVASAAVLISAVDQVVKCWVVAAWPVGYSRAVTTFFSVVHWRNTGAAWGMFPGFNLALGLFSLIVLAALMLGFRLFTEYERTRSVAWGLICGGILGNAIDRIGRGAVVDYLFFYYRSIGWPAFNIADSAITAGVVIYLLAAMVQGRSPCDTQSRPS